MKTLIINGSVISHNTNNLPASDDEYAILKIRTVAERMNEI